MPSLLTAFADGDALRCTGGWKIPAVHPSPAAVGAQMRQPAAV